MADQPILKRNQRPFCSIGGSCRCDLCQKKRRGKRKMKPEYVDWDDMQDMSPGPHY